MDIQQPQLYGSGGLGGGIASAGQSRFLQDVYRAVKCPNFAMSKTTYQDCSHNAWTNLTWDYVFFNNLNCFNTANNRCAPMVPGYYSVYTKISGYWSGTAPNANSGLYLGIWDANDVNVTDMMTTPTSTTGWGSGAQYVTLQVSALVYLSGNGTGAQKDDYKFISLYNGTGQTFRVLGRDTSSALQPRFQAHKITY